MKKRMLKKYFALWLTVLLAFAGTMQTAMLEGEGAMPEAVEENVSAEAAEENVTEGLQDESSEENADVTETAEEATPAVIDIMYLDKDTDIRLAPNGLSEILITAPVNAQLNVYAYEGYWAKVSYNTGSSGMIHGYVYCRPVDVEQMAVEIFSSRRSVMSPGETVQLTCVLYGMDGYSVSYQWECDKGNGFEAVAGANADSYSFIASVETLGYNWRLAVSVE